MADLTDDEWRALGLMTPTEWDGYRAGITLYLKMRRELSGEPDEDGDMGDRE